MWACMRKTSMYTVPVTSPIAVMLSLLNNYLTLFTYDSECITNLIIPFDPNKSSG